MPQASDETRSWMIERFGSIDSHGPEQFLLDAGYELTPEWEWRKEGVNELRDMTREEFDCLLFLCHEWDYGSLVGAI